MMSLKFNYLDINTVVAHIRAATPKWPFYNRKHLWFYGVWAKVDFLKELVEISIPNEIWIELEGNTSWEKNVNSGHSVR